MSLLARLGLRAACVLWAAPAAAAPIVYTHHPGVFESAPRRVLQGDPRLAAPFEALRAAADEALRLEPRSVVDKPRRAASGDPHDYFSFAPYWWPDPARPGGLPYIRRDGRRNPESRHGTDRETLQAMGEAFETLALAYHFTGGEPYARQAVRLLRAWLLDPATRMNPHLRYAQAIPGITEGRGIGIIEGRYLMPFYEAQPLVFASEAWTKADEKAYREWLEAFRHWLLTSDNGRDEADEENNHGTWYDVQIVQLSLALGHLDEARAYVARALEHRIATQIEPDGRQPHELSRTRSFNYCLLNLAGLMRLAVSGEHLGVDAWKIRTEDGRSLEKAVAFVAPFVDPDRRWVADDIDAPDRTRLLPILSEAARHLDDPRYRQGRDRHDAQAGPSARWRLFE